MNIYRHKNQKTEVDMMIFKQLNLKLQKAQ